MIWEHNWQNPNPKVFFLREQNFSVTPHSLFLSCPFLLIFLPLPLYVSFILLAPFNSLKCFFSQGHPLSLPTRLSCEALWLCPKAHSSGQCKFGSPSLSSSLSLSVSLFIVSCRELKALQSVQRDCVFYRTPAVVEQPCSTCSARRLLAQLSLLSSLCFLLFLTTTDSPFVPHSSPLSHTVITSSSSTRPLTHMLCC